MRALSHEAQPVFEEAGAREPVQDFSRGPLRACTFDRDYVQGLVDGNPSIENHFVAHFSELLSLILRSRVRSREMIEDVRQETFARVFRLLRQQGGLEHPERLGAFVYSVCRHILLENFREEGKYASMGPAYDAWPDNRIELDEPLISQERKSLVKKVLAKLRRRDQELLRMIFIEEVDNEEACRRLGVRYSYMRVMLHRALKRFQKELLGLSAPDARFFLSWGRRDGVKQKCQEDHYSSEDFDGA
ncbi:MAG TPA: sigma-70 family RNA polymerase sigma factor [Bryobacterales bacterium]|nr:sigma-70 family RNA polymerase sigma factor [Bryobacterales bacterium]